MNKFTTLMLILMMSLGLLVPVAFAAEIDAQAMISCFMAPDFCGKTLSACEGGISENMRQEVAAMVDSGKTKDEIIQHYVGIYGMQILSAPPKEGFYLTAWFMPVIGLAAGVAIMFGYMQRTKIKGSKQSNANSQADNGAYDEEVEEELKKYI
ncbi:cytochrome c-type biogenesis protein CcmH [Metallumcola ferriviriculae]|uniref:Cytochrome c-type biogenesis protein n=1 Tax=Metallumcola ferriviriculae TaxID=3039180 RepID=A0AAU0UNN1_9FIRM|nr:cytochrome c-type biogenesis protein CcmH [Desulfitibacteraceae bacterium MK1]